MKRWIPKVGEAVTVAGGLPGLPWIGIVIRVEKEGCDRDEVCLTLTNVGTTMTSKHEITIHNDNRN